MNPTEALAELLEAARGVDVRWRTCSDEQLLADGAAWETLGRLVDSRRIGYAAEVEDRSRPVRGEGGLAFRRGERDGASLVAHTMRISIRSARQRVAIGVALKPGFSFLSDEETPGKHPVLGVAVRAGLVGLDSARVIASMLHRVARHADHDACVQAEGDLTAEAVIRDTEAIREAVAVRGEALHPDGPEPRDHEARRQRAIRIGAADAAGGSKFWGYLPVEERAVLLAALAQARRAKAMARTDAGEESNEDLDAEWRETDDLHRTTAQIDFDTFWGVFTAGIRASAAESTSSTAVKSIPEVIVTITADDLADTRHGAGWLAGVRIPVSTVQRLTCGSDVRLVLEGDAGEPLWLGHPVREFTPAQRRALIARYQGCAWPGCTAPAIWCDVHHIDWWHRDDGPTDVDNGILLCSFHHHAIHATDALWRIVIHDKTPHLVPKRWSGKPDHAHRMRTHPRQTFPRPPGDGFTPRRT